MDFREYEITRDGDDVVVSGTIHEPVNWDFTIRVTGDDIPGMLRLGLHRHTLAMAARWVLRRGAKAPAPTETRAPPVSEKPVRAPAPPETSAVPTRSPRLPASARRVPAEPQEEPRAPAKPDEATSRPRPASGTSPPTGPPTAGFDFGAPRRRGGANGGRASVTDEVVEGDRS